MISVCVPVFNGEAFLSQCLDSISSQTEPDFELVVCDDQSTDRSSEIVLEHKDVRLRYYQNQRQLGLVGNWNRCIDLATGEYIIIFHQDDLMRPIALKGLYQLFIGYPQIGFAFSNVEIIDEKSRSIGKHWTPDALPDTTSVISGRLLLERIFHNGNIVPCQTVMVRKTCYQHLGFFDTRLQLTPDLDMWLRLASAYDAAYSHEQLISIRQHPRQTSHKFTERDNALEVWRAFWIYFSKNLEAHSSPAFYNMALEHLANWSGMMMRSHLRVLHISRTIQLINLWLKFKSYQRGGLGKMPVFPSD
jgi:glycosyltransferase involved in cell wall biosynthesis